MAGDEKATKKAARDDALARVINTKLPEAVGKGADARRLSAPPATAAGPSPRLAMTDIMTEAAAGGGLAVAGIAKFKELGAEKFYPGQSCADFGYVRRRCSRWPSAPTPPA